MSNLKSILSVFVVLGIAIVFIVGFNPMAGRQVRTSDTSCAIEIRGSCIASTDFWASYRLLAPRGADAAKLRAMGLRRITADGLYERWLLNEDAKRLGITVSDDELNTELANGRAHTSLPADKMRQVGYALGLGEDLVRFLYVRNRQTKKFDSKAYEREVRMLTKMSPTDFREYQKKELIASRMRDLIRARVRVGEREGFDQFSYEKSTRTIDTIRFDRRFYADLVADASERAVLAWADQNKEEVDKTWEARKTQYLPECRVTRHILAKVNPGADGEEAAKAAAKEKIDRAAARLKGGAGFADVARRLSDDTSAARGGDLGCVAKGQMVKPFEDKVFELKEGEVSAPVETEYGFHIIQVQRIAKDADAEKVARLQIQRELYLSHESERLAAEAAKQVLSAVGGGKSMQEALDAHLATIEAAAAGDKKKGDKKDDKNVEAGGEDAQAVEENAPVTLATHPHRPTVEASIPFNVSGDPIPSAKPGTDVARMAFELAKPGDVPKDVVALDTGYAVVQLKESTPASQEQWEKEREFYLSAMRAAKQNDALVGYLRRLRSTIGSEVKFDTALVTEPKETTEGEPEDATPIEDEGE